MNNLIRILYVSCWSRRRDENEVCQFQCLKNKGPPDFRCGEACHRGPTVKDLSTASLPHSVIDKCVGPSSNTLLVKPMCGVVKQPTQSWHWCTVDLALHFVVVSNSYLPIIFQPHRRCRNHVFHQSSHHGFLFMIELAGNSFWATPWNHWPILLSH